jgi:pectate lyase
MLEPGRPQSSPRPDDRLRSTRRRLLTPWLLPFPVVLVVVIVVVLIVVLAVSILVASGTGPRQKPSPYPTNASCPVAAGSGPPPVQSLSSTNGYGGYAAATVGGAGGIQIVVSNLDDSGPGSLRAALEARVPRIVVFSVAGTISVRDSLKIENPYITVAGETAPQPGIVLRNGPLKVLTHDVILRHLRLRPGDQVTAPADADALTLTAVNTTVYNVVVDHVSMVWGPDIGGLAVLGNVRDVTVSNSIMGEGLYFSAHPEAIASMGGHAYAANLTQLDPKLGWPTCITFWQNLFTTSDHRMPRLQGAACVDVVDNVIYNWGIHAANGNPRSVNLVNNWYRSGPETTAHEFWTPQESIVDPVLFNGVVFEVGSIADGFSGSRGGSPAVYAATVRCGGLSVTPEPAESAYSAVLQGAGATLPVRDVVDQRIIANVKNRQGTYFNGAGFPSPNPYWP